MALETPSRPPPFMANAILNFHFDYLTTSLSFSHELVKFCCIFVQAALDIVDIVTQIHKCLSVSTVQTESEMFRFGNC